MAFDAGMTAAVVHELKNTVSAARVEKVQQPEKDEIVLLLHVGRENYRLCLSASPGSARVNLTGIVKENPLVAPMFCMLLRKHLTGAKLTDIRQLEFERVIEFAFEGTDEMGFVGMRYLYAEIMGKCSNIILTDGEKRILGAVHSVDFTTSRVRQVLPGMLYELPPKQDKLDPRTVTKDTFLALWGEGDPNGMPDKFLLGRFLGLSPLVTRELALGAADPEALWEAFSGYQKRLAEEDFVPVLIRDESKKPTEYCFMPIRQYGSAATTERCESFSQLIDLYFAGREKIERTRQRAADILKLLTGAESRLTRKIAAQEEDLRRCADKDKYKLWGDLITAGMHTLERGMTHARLVNYWSDTMEEVEVKMDSRLTPSQNAQRYYKLYNKAKVTETEVGRQLAMAREELAYLYTVFDSLTRADTEADLEQIREELYRSGYASRMKNYQKKKLPPSRPLEFRTDGGYRVLCGRNNTQNDEVTTRLANKNDYWFHVKGQPGSHVLLICDDEPGEVDFTQAAIIAACHSKAADGQNVAVDYTRARYVKKPAGARPGFVIYTTNWTAYVTPDADLVERLRVKDKRN